MIQSRAMNLGLIGFGRFGQFAANHLRLRLNLVVWDPRDLRRQAAALGLSWGTLADAASQPFVLMAVPISELPSCLESVAPHLSPGALFMDCCSVKVRPIEWMLKALPEDVEIVGVHPLFGPGSARAGLGGLQVVLCPGRGGRIELVGRFLEEMGLRVHVLTPEEHDRLVAATMALTQFLGRGLLAAGLQEIPLGTPAFEHLLRMVEMVRGDSTTLFHDMHRLNPFAAVERRRLIEALLKIHNDLESLSTDIEP